MGVTGRCAIVALLAILCAGCGHTSVSKIAVLSDGNLLHKTIPAKVEGPTLVGKSEASTYNQFYYLSTAVRNALMGTDYDTLVDVTVTAKTGLWVWSNSLEVSGTGINSSKLPSGGK